MRVLMGLIALAGVSAAVQKPFTIEQALSAPYSTNLTAAPAGARFAWVEHVEGRNNLWVGEPGKPARMLTHNTEDDAQDIGSVTWSPDGSVIAYVYGAAMGASGKPANPAHLQRPTPVELILQPVDGGEAVHLQDARSPVFLAGGESLIFTRGGQLWSVMISTGDVCDLQCWRENPNHELRPLATTLLPSMTPHQLVFDRGSASGATLSPDGKLVAYVSHRRTHNFLALYNLQTKTLTFPAPSTGNDSAPVFSRDGKYLAWLRWPWTDTSEFATNRVSANPWSVQVMDVATGKTRMVFQPEANKPGSAEPRMSTGEPRLMWTADDRVLFFAEMDGWVHVYAQGLEEGTAKLLTPGKFEVEDAVVSADGTSLLYASSQVTDDPLDADRRHLWGVDLGHNTSPVRLSSSVEMEMHPAVAADGKTIAALSSSVDWPAHPVIVEANGNLRPMHTDDAPKDYPARAMLTPVQVKFPAADKLFEVHGQLFQPRAGGGEMKRDRNSDAPKRRPALIFFHGGPRRQMLLGYPSMDYYSNAYAMNQYLASRGYIVLSVNYRGGIGYGLDFRQCEHCGGDGAAEYADALGAVAYLKSRPDVDASRIGIWGGSYGGYFTALGLARNSDLFAAGVDFHGVHEWAREDNAPGDWLRSATNDPEEVARIAKRAHESSPMADVDKWKSPVLFIHGDDDPDVAYIQTPMLADALRARNVHVEELIFPDELHGFVLHKDWVKAYEATADFFDRMLKAQP